MSKVFIVVFLIFGTVVGSGFASGKEIFVYFTRFGQLSFLYILLACLLFFLIFYFFLTKGERVLKKFDKLPFLTPLMLFVSLTFCASMFAGIKNLFFYFPVWLYYVLFLILLACCIFVTFKGIKGLEKINLFLMPITMIVFIVVLGFGLASSSVISYQTTSWAGVLYCPLYVALNTCMEGIIISKAGMNLSKKQAFWASLLSSGLIFVFLFVGNLVLIKNGDMLDSAMPFLSIAGKNVFVFMLCYCVILIGCFTTLISLCYTLKIAFQKVLKNNVAATLVAVLLPLCISILGFSQIVSFLYPIASVLGVFMLFFLI